MSSDHAQADEQQIRALLETRLAALRARKQAPASSTQLACSGG